MLKRHSIRSFFQGLLIAAVIGGGADGLWAQSATRGSLPGVDLPPPTMEASPFPAMDEVVPPSVSGDVYRAPMEPELEPYVEGQDVPMDSDQPLDMGPTPVFEDGFSDEHGVTADCFTDSHVGELEYPGDSLRCDEGPAPIYSTGTWFWRGNWYTQMDFAYMTRESPRDVLLAFERQPPRLNTPGLVDVESFRGNDLIDHNYQPGVRLTLGRFLGRDAAGRDHMTEFTFFGLVEWDGFRQITATGRPILNTIDGNVAPVHTALIASVLNTATGVREATPATAGFLNNTRQTYEYDAEFNSFEANYRIHTRPERDVLALQPNGAWVRHGMATKLRSVFGGLRYVGFDETVDYRGFGEVDNGFVVNDDFNSTYQVLTNNDLVGVHGGLSLTDKYDEWSWGFRGKVGLLGNLTQRRSWVLDAAGDQLLRPENLDDEQMAFSSEAGLFMTYQLRPNLHFKAAYDFMLITGLTLAQENLGFDNGFPTLNSNGTVVMHGGSLGFETMW